MIESDTELAYRGPAVNDIDVTKNYNIGLFKSAAWNPELFFNASYYTKEEAELIAEAWEIFDNYARSRTANCLYLDADDLLFSCDQDAPNTTSIWNFSDSSDIFATEQNQASSVELTDEFGEAQICGSSLLSCGTTESLSVPALPDGSIGNIIKLRALTALSNGRFELSTQHAANGDFASLDRISNYTLVFDALWPASDKYRALSMPTTTMVNPTSISLQKEILESHHNMKVILSLILGIELPWYSLHPVKETSRTSSMPMASLLRLCVMPVWGNFGRWTEVGLCYLLIPLTVSLSRARYT